jgi:hypothetical protein
MSFMHVEQSAVIPAPPAAVYALLADYQHGHPAILPRPYFAGLQVEAGGVGAGTRLRVEMHVYGVTQVYHLEVSEPQPGTVLAESDPQRELTTTFTVTPFGTGEQCTLRIATEWRPAPGLAGFIERLTTPSFMRRIYTEELALVAAHFAA